MGAMNLRLARKAYMFEFRDGGNKSEYFSFAVPPESEDFSFPQRVTETKTLGGSVFDDYGNDTVQIQLNGTTVNQERRVVFKGAGNDVRPDYITGEQEIFRLQELIDKWGKGEKLPGKKIYLYDLSKMSLLEIAGGRPSRNHWRVVIKKFKFRRAKDRPNTYQYSLDMTGMEDTEGETPSLFGKGMTPALEKCQEVLKAFEEIYGAMEEMAAVLDTATAAVASAKKAFESAKNGGPLTVIDGIFDAPMRLMTGGSGTSVYNACKSMLAAGYRIQALANGEEQGNRSTGTASRDDIFTVAFDTAGGTLVKSEKAAYSRTVAMPADPAKERHSFSGWYADSALLTEYDFGTEITGNITLYAKWTQTVAVVSYSTGLGTPVPPATVPVGGAVTPPAPPNRDGYKFDFWCTDPEAPNGYEFSAPVTGDMTLYARWKAVCKVSFSSGGGSAVDGQTVDIGGKAVFPPVPSRGNYLFVAWYADSALLTEYDFSTEVTGSFTLYAKWTQVSNTVSFDSNGGTAVPNQEAAIGGQVRKPENPEREGYRFARWCVDTELTQEFFFDTATVNCPMRLYAAWSVITFAVEFDCAGGSGAEIQDVVYGKLAVYPVTPLKEGSIFAGWRTAAGAEYDFSAPVLENMTLYAKWHEGGGA